VGVGILAALVKWLLGVVQRIFQRYTYDAPWAIDLVQKFKVRRQGGGMNRKLNYDLPEKIIWVKNY